MKPEQVTEALEAAATQMGVRVRYDSLAPGTGTGGGLCRVRGQWWVIIDKKTTPSERAAALTEAFAGLDTESVFLPPKIREAIQTRRGDVAAR